MDAVEADQVVKPKFEAFGGGGNVLGKVAIGLCAWIPRVSWVQDWTNDAYKAVKTASVTSQPAARSVRQEERR